MQRGPWFQLAKGVSDSWRATEKERGEILETFCLDVLLTSTNQVSVLQHCCPRWEESVASWVDFIGAYQQNRPLLKPGSPPRHRGHGGNCLMIQSQEDDWIIKSIPSENNSSRHKWPCHGIWAYRQWKWCFLLGDLSSPSKNLLLGVLRDSVVKTLFWTRVVLQQTLDKLESLFVRYILPDCAQQWCRKGGGTQSCLFLAGL